MIVVKIKGDVAHTTIFRGSVVVNFYGISLLHPLLLRNVVSHARDIYGVGSSLFDTTQ